MSFKQIRLDVLFEVKSGDFHAVKELDEGKIPLISCGDTDNGHVGFYEIPREHTYMRALTVAYNGSWPLTTKFHPYRFGAKDDVAVLVPRLPLQTTTLLYVAFSLNRMTWRYSYGRKCFREKLRNLMILIPASEDNETLKVDEAAIASFYSVSFPESVAEKVGQALQITQLGS